MVKKMNKIHVMNETLANKIAAGEVIERVSSVVKELVENSIDAKSDIIRIELIDSGVKQIRVIDNGVGMDKEDALMCFSRHATSKLKTLNDLSIIRIKTVQDFLAGQPEYKGKKILLHDNETLEDALLKRNYKLIPKD